MKEGRCLQIRCSGTNFDVETFIKANERETFKMAEEEDMEINFLPTNTSEIHLHMEQLLQSTY